MNFLGHLCLANGDAGLMLGGMFGDFVRGRRALRAFPDPVCEGVMLHRHIDRFTDHAPAIRQLRRTFPREFRRYAGIIIDLGFDHELAANWSHYMPGSLEQFDVEVRDLLREHDELVPERLNQFMDYADRHGLFAAYRDEGFTQFALAGVGTRLKRPNPLHRVAEIWPDIAPGLAATFRAFFPQVQSEVLDWREARSTNTGS